MRYQNQKWSIDLPEGWSYDDSESLVAFFHPEGFGAVVVAVHEKQSLVTIEDLYEFSEGHQIEEHNLDTFIGLYATRVDDDGYFTEHYWLAGGQYMIYLTYSCDEASRGIESDAVKYIVGSLEVMRG